MSIDELVPRPPVVRDRLAENYREAAELRRLLRMSERVAEMRAERAAKIAAAPDGREVARG